MILVCDNNLSFSFETESEPGWCLSLHCCWEKSSWLYSTNLPPPVNGVKTHQEAKGCLSSRLLSSMEGASSPRQQRTAQRSQSKLAGSAQTLQHFCTKPLKVLQHPRWSFRTSFLLLPQSEDGEVCHYGITSRQEWVGSGQEGTPPNTSQWLWQLDLPTPPGKPCHQVYVCYTSLMPKSTVQCWNINKLYVFKKRKIKQKAERLEQIVLEVFFARGILWFWDWNNGQDSHGSLSHPNHHQT